LRINFGFTGRGILPVGEPERYFKELEVKKMKFTLIRKSLILPYILAMLVLPLSSAVAAESMTVPSITPLPENLPEMFNKRLGIPGMRVGFIKGFRNEGVVVINDSAWKIAPGVRLSRKYEGSPVFLTEFQVGMYVGFTLNDNAQVDVMWIIE